MKALIKRIPTSAPEWYRGLELADVPEPSATAQRPVKVRVVSAGICGTDVGIYQGKDSLAIAMARVKQDSVILGHEFCGTIADVHDSARLELAQLLARRKNATPKVTEYLASKTAEELARRDDLVPFLGEHFYATAEMHFTCGACLQCRTGDEHVCKNTIGKGIHEDGMYAEYGVLPANRVVLIEKGEISPKIVSFMDALGNAVHTAQSADLVGATVLITGAGVQGLMSTAVARQMGANKIFVTDVGKPGGIDKLALAARLGADQVFDVGTEPGRAALAEAVRRETEGTGVDIVFEMSGNYGAYGHAFENVRMGGTVLLLGLPAGRMEVDFSTDVIFKGLTIKGIYGRRVFDTWSLMRYLLSKGLAETILASGIITHQLPLERYEEGFQALASGRAIKVLLTP